MAILTSNGITFGDSTQLNSKYGIIPQGKTSVFYQASAPTGWTKSVTHNNKALRVVSGTGGGSGGTIDFTTAFPISRKSFDVTVTVTGTVGNTTLTTPQIPSHNHPGSSVNPQGANHNHQYDRAILSTAPTSGSANFAFYVAANTFGQDGSHTHPFSINNSTQGGSAHSHPWSGSGPASNSVDTRVKYLDVILCSFD
jgi:hypothetical protein